MRLSTPISLVPKFTRLVIFTSCGFCAFLMGALICLFDVFTTGMYLSEMGMRDLSYLLLISAFLLMPARLLSRYFSRKKGRYFGLVFLLFFVLLGMYWWILHQHIAIASLWLFTLKYPVIILLSAGFLGVASRVIHINTQGVNELWGYLFLGGAFFSFGVYFYHLDMDVLLNVMIGLSLCVYLFLIGIIYYFPVEKEMFITKTSSAQTLIEQRLVNSSYVLAFLTFFAECICLSLFYKALLSEAIYLGITQTLCLWWLLFSGLGVIIVMLVARFKYFSILSGSMFFLIVALIGVAFGLDKDNWLLILGSFALLEVVIVLYYNDYIFSLMKLLGGGHKKSIAKKRLVFVEPIGFMVCALMLIYGKVWIQQSSFLYGLAIILYCVIVLTMRSYSILLLRLLQIRGWREGVLISPLAKKYIQTHIQTADPDEVIYFLRLLEKARSFLYVKCLLKALKYQNETVRLYALKTLGNFKNAQRYFKTINWVFQTDSSPKVRCLALSLLIVLSYKENADTGVNDYLKYLDSRILKQGAMSGLLQTGGVQALLAMEGLQRFVNSKKEKDNLIALDIMDLAPSVGLIRLVNRLLKSTNVIVANRALLLAGKIAHPEFLPFILKALMDFDLRENALIALKSYGVRAFPLIEKVLYNPQTPAYQRKTLILFLTSLNSGRGKQILLRALKIGDQNLRKTIIQGMIDRGIFWIHKGKYQLLKLGIEKDMTRILWIHNFLEKYRHAPSPQTRDIFSFLTRAMKEDLLQTKEILLYQLLLLKDDFAFKKAVRILLSDKKETYGVALGVLQDMLPRDLYQMISKVILLGKEDKTEVLTSAILPEVAVTDLSQILLNPPFQLPDWIQACLLGCLRQLGSQEGLLAVEQGLTQTNPLILESAVWAFMKLEKDEVRRHKILLKVPTSLLTTQLVENILKDSEIRNDNL